MKSIKTVKPAYEDPDNSVDLFDANRTNEFGQMYCVAPAILYRQVDEYWADYLKELEFETAFLAAGESSLEQAAEWEDSAIDWDKYFN